jgi:hypothetical protein
MSVIDRLRSWLFGSDRTENTDTTDEKPPADESEPQLDPDKTTEVRTERSLSGVDTLKQMREANESSNQKE